MPVKKRQSFTPVAGGKASVKLENGAYADVHVNAIFRGGYFAKITLPNEESIKVPVSELEKPLVSDVNERFEYFRQLTELVINKQLRSLFVTGEGGIGKSHTVNDMLEAEGLEEEKDYIRIKGFATARAMFNVLEDNNDKLFIFDDCDSVLKDSTALNILKGVLDTYQRRYVRWMTAKGGSTGFEFNGSVIFLSNLAKENVSQAVLSRATVIDLFMTPEEKIARMGYLLPSLGVTKLPLDERMRVLKMIDKFKHTINDLNLRTLIKALIVYENTESLEITRYQILNG